MEKKSWLIQASLLLLLLPALLTNLWAQNYSAEKDQPLSKGYWRLKTDYASRRSLFQVFDTGQQLIYQEWLPGRYLKLNRKNTQLLDQLCRQLLDNQLVASTLKPSLLPQEVPVSLQQYHSSLSEDKKKNVSPSTGNFSSNSLQANALLRPVNKLQVLFINPSQQRRSILLKNEEGHFIYEENTFLSTYNRCLDLSGLPAGQYTLVVSGAKDRYVRCFSLAYSDEQPLLQWLSQPNIPSLR